MRWGVAVAVLILAGIPAERGYAQQSSAQSNQAESAPSQPDGYYRPCSREEENRDSDLCAQWRANDWARRSYIIGWLGVAGLIVTLLFNLEAWSRARKAEGDTETALGHAETSAKAATELAETAEKTARAELRAYLDFNGVRIERWPKRDKEGSGNVAVRASICIKNYGRTPAENLEITTINYVQADGRPKLPFTVEDKIDFSFIAPSDHANHFAHWQMPELYWKAVEQQKLMLIVSLIVTYTDVFTEPHVLRSDFETFDVGEELGLVKGTRNST